MIDFDLRGTPHTLILPLVGRANSPLLYPREEFDDPSARQTLKQLRYRSPLIKQSRTLIRGAVGRTLAFQQEAQHFISKHPTAQIVCLGCGLSNYFQWLDNGIHEWRDVDLPEVIELRQKLISFQTDRHQHHRISILDQDFFPSLNLSKDTPTLFICEGVFMYLDRQQIAEFLSKMNQSVAPMSQIIFDHISALAKSMNRFNPYFLKWGTQFRWGLSDLNEIGELNSSLDRIHTRSLDATSFPAPWIKNCYEFFARVPNHGLSILQKKGN